MQCRTPLIRPAKRQPFAFTLVELLVVIGIIALLISILMPSLSMARQAANRVACSAKLHQIVVAAQIHANDHQGFYPLAGLLPGFDPSNLDDPYSTKYDYMRDPAEPFPVFQTYLAPITISLASEMGYGSVLRINNNAALGTAETDSQGFIRNFLCPSQAGSISELTQLPMLYFGTESFSFGGNNYLGSDIYWEQQSYNFNEAILGFADADTSNRLMGQASRVRQPAKTMFAADGLMGSLFDSRYPSPPGYGMATFYNISNNPGVTLADAFTNDGMAGDPQNFDLLRHHGKINIAFCDGHVETRSITNSNGTGCPDLQSVYLLAP